MARVLILLAVLSAAVVLGLRWRARQGRVRARAGTHRRPLAALGVDAGEARITLVQFSSAACAPCRDTRVLLADVAQQFPGVRHVEVDAGAHLDAVRTLGVRSTPTTLVVDAAGRTLGTITGRPRRGELVTVLRSHLDRADRLAT